MGTPRKKVLVIAPQTPFPEVPHAGGKILFGHLKSLREMGFEITLVTSGDGNQIKKAKNYWDKEGVKANFVPYPPLEGNLLIRFLYLISWITRKIPGLNIFWNPYLLFYFKRIFKNLLKPEDFPDMVIIEWTECTPFIKILKKILPKNLIFVAVEHDVTFQRLFRKSKNSPFPLNLVFFAAFNYVKKEEVKLLKKFDWVLTFNPKDSKLLEENGLPSFKIKTVIPSFQRFYSVNHNFPEKTGIIFYGAMNRKENADGVLWFTKNVWPFLKKKFPDLIFYVVGNNPGPELKSLSGKPGIEVTGFVPDPSPYFKISFAGIAPLRLGAGIKIKILEMLSAGLPVLTNGVGIEGIPATPGEHFFYCDSPRDYIECLTLIKNSPEIFEEVSNKARNFIKTNYDSPSLGLNFEEIIKELRVL